MPTKRYAFINVWRNCVKDPVVRMPLALCEGNSVAPEHWKLFELRYPDRVGENYTLTSKDAHEHQWYYYPQMKQEEALLFTTYDSDSQRIRTVFHSAFEHPGTPLDAP